MLIRLHQNVVTDEGAVERSQKAGTDSNRIKENGSNFALPVIRSDVRVSGGKNALQLRE